MAGQLSNIRYENFAKKVAKGMTLAQAYVEAGFSETGKQNASTLAKRPEIVERIEEIRALLSMDEDADEQTLLIEVKDMITQITLDGNPTEQSIKIMLMRCVHAGIKGTPVSGAISALKLLGGERGMFQEKPKEPTPAEKAKTIIDQTNKPRMIEQGADPDAGFFAALKAAGEEVPEAAAATVRVTPEEVMQTVASPDDDADEALFANLRKPADDGEDVEDGTAS